MYINEARRSVILRAREPVHITTLIPHASTFIHKGHQLLEVPHRTEEARLLRNLGLKVPAPFLHYYKWAREPFEAQRQTAAFMTLHPRAFVLNSLGTGKTSAALAAFDFMRSEGLANKALVISPLSTLERTWADEILRYFPNLTSTVLHGSARQRLALLDDTGVDVYLINHDGIKIPAVEAALMDRKDIDVVIVDELAVFRTAPSKRWKALNRILRSSPTRIIWGMTGTPVPNDPTDAWAQVKLVLPDQVPRYFSQFKNTVMRQVGPFRWIPHEGALDIVDQMMQPSIRYTREQCVELPPVTHLTRSVSLTPDQSAMYVALKKEMLAQNAKGTVTAVNSGVLLLKLLQVACGVVRGDEDKLIELAVKNRVDVINEVIEQSEGKVIVFAPFTAVLDMLGKQLAKRWDVGRIDGGVSKSERDRIFGGFQEGTSPQVILAQPAAMSHGLTLTAASTIVWYGPPLSHETFEQANGRITRPGQTRKQLIVCVEGCEAERRVYQSLRAKETVQNIFLKIVQDKEFV